MSIKLLEENIDWGKLLKRASKSEGILIPVSSHGKNSAVRLLMKKVPRYYHNLKIDVDGTGYKISDQGRKALASLISFYGEPDVRTPKRSFVDTYSVDLEVQRGGDSTEGEERILDQLALLLEKSENLEDLVKPTNS